MVEIRNLKRCETKKRRRKPQLIDIAHFPILLMFQLNVCSDSKRNKTNSSDLCQLEWDGEWRKGDSAIIEWLNRYDCDGD